MHSVLYAFTHSVVWASVIASVFVAAFVTLVIEYLAKPRLEVRKDRILEKSRERRKAMHDFRRALNLTNKLITFRSAAPPMVGLMDEHIKRSTIDVQDHMFAAFEFIEVPQSIRRQWEYTVSTIHAVSVVPPAMWSSLPDNIWNEFEDAFERMKDFHQLFKLSKRHRLRKRKLIRKIAASPAPIRFTSAQDRDGVSA